ncbi:MAG: energy-coupled thiamine transporter ThiT [Candidatus Bathyarchaeota archaeon]|nr:energy-coupled thiamine transporter ThiT [Candidatus Bathyarchaeota archaeon]
MNLIRVIPAEGKKMKTGTTSTRVLAEMAIMVALATVLSMIKIFNFPQGGSITLGSMIPILLISLRRGPKIGISTGAVYGLVQLVLDGYIGLYNPLSLLLDYPIAFGALGLSGLIRKPRLAGVYLGITGRFLAHFISGFAFFYMYAPPGMDPVIYSAVYNMAYILPEMVICGIIINLIPERIITTYL